MNDIESQKRNCEELKSQVEGKEVEINKEKEEKRRLEGRREEIERELAGSQLEAKRWRELHDSIRDKIAY